MSKPATFIETLNAAGTLAASAAAVVGVWVAVTALNRPESLQKLKDLQALATARNLAFFAHRENLEEFRLAATGHHVNNDARFDTVLTGLKAIKFEQVPPNLTEDFINIWSQTHRAKKMSEENKSDLEDTKGETKFARSLMLSIDAALIRGGVSFDADCKAIIDQTPIDKDGCAAYR